MQLPHPEVLLSVDAPLGALDRDGEYRVAPGAPLVHLGGADHAVLVAHRHHLVHVVGVVHHEGGEVLDVDADVRPLLDLESVKGIEASLVKTNTFPHFQGSKGLIIGCVMPRPGPYFSSGQEG